jgi:ribose transport system substrate-binding protein
MAEDPREATVHDLLWRVHRGRLTRREFMGRAMQAGIASFVAAAYLDGLRVLGYAATVNLKLPALPYDYTHDTPERPPMTPAGKWKKPGPYTIGFSNNYSANSWRTNMIWCLKYDSEDPARLKKYLKGPIIITEAQESVPKQISDIEGLAAQGVDAILLEPSVGSALNPVVTKVMNEGIPVVPFDGVLKGAPYATWVGMNLRYLGYKSALWLVEKLGNRGDILVVRGQAGNFIDTLWYEVTDKVFKASNLHIVGQIYSNWDFATGKTEASKFLAAHPGKIDGIWNENGAAAQGVMEAFIDANRPVPPIMGDQNNGYLKLWDKLRKQSGYEAACFIYPTWLSSLALRDTLKLLQGESLPHDDYQPLIWFGSKDLDKYVQPGLPDNYFSAHYLPASWIKKMLAAGK